MPAPPKSAAGRAQLLAELREKVLELHQGSTEVRANRHAAQIHRGQEALPELAAALDDPEQEARIDALVAIGRIFEKGEVTADAVDAVLAHSKRIKERGIGPERHAALYALGRSKVPALVHGFIQLLKAEDPQTVNVGSYVLGYARWEQALPYLKFVATKNFAPTAEAAIWALGEIRSKDALEALLTLSTHGKHLETVLPALATIGDPSALEVMVPVLSSHVPQHRHLASAAIWSIVTQVKEQKDQKKSLAWLIPPLRVASGDDFGPVAAHAVLSLAMLGEKLDEDVVRRAMGLEAKSMFTREESFLLTRDTRKPS